MPVTAKLSKSFYDALGEDVADQLVDWFNLVDATYRADLRELNEGNFHRFDAKLVQRLAEFESRVTQQVLQVRADLERRISESETRFDAKLDERFAGLRLEERLSELRQEVQEMLASLEYRLTTAVETKIETLATKTQLAELRAEMSEKLGNQLKWTIGLWVGMLALVGAGIFL